MKSEFEIDFNISLLWFVFFASITGYNFVKFFGLAKFHHRSLATWLKLIQVISIFSFKNRKSQFILGRLNIILNFILLGVFVYQSLNLSGETDVSEKGIGMILPIFSIVFLALANKAIKKDEDLVKSVDRLR